MLGLLHQNLSKFASRISKRYISQTRPPLPNLVFTQTKKCIEMEEKYLAKTYPMLPIVLHSGKGINVTDVDGNTYYDFNSANCTLNHGILH